MANTLATLNGLLDSALRDTSNETWTSAEKDALIERAVRNLYPRISFQLDPESYTHTLVSEDYFYPLKPEVMSISRVDLVESDGTERGPLRDGTWEMTGRVGVPKFAVLTTSANGDDIIDTAVAHDFRAGDAVRFLSLTGGTGLTVGTTYYVIAGNLGSTTLQVSTTVGGSAELFSSDITAGTIEGANAKLHVSPTVVERWAGHTIRLNGYGRYDTLYNYIPDDYIELVIAEASKEALKWLMQDRSRFLQNGTTRQDQSISVTELVTMLNAAEQRAREERSRWTTFRKPVPGRI